jgi:hypothetical protein
MRAMTASLHTANPLWPASVTALSVALLALATAAPAPATAQQLYKWTDEQGQVHYSDHAPAGQATTNVPLPKAAKVSKPAGGPSTSPPYAADVDENGRTPQQAAQAEAEREAMRKSKADRLADEEREADERDRMRQNKIDEERRAAQSYLAQQASKKTADQAKIAECKANHETYCFGNADRIRQAEQAQAQERAHEWALAHHAVTQVCDKSHKRCKWEAVK